MKTAVSVLSLSLALLGFVSPALSASFNCSKASSDVEVAICRSPKLSKLDEQMAEKFRHDLKSKTYPAAVRSARDDQASWLANVRNKCADDMCLFSAYHARIQELTPKITDKEMDKIVADAKAAYRPEPVVHEPNTTEPQQRSFPDPDRGKGPTKKQRDEYAAELESRFSNRILVNNDAAGEIYSTFEIDCRSPDHRVLPLKNLLLSRLSGMTHLTSNSNDKLVTMVVTIGDDTRIYDQLTRDGSPISTIFLLEINKWGEIRSHGLKMTAVREVCFQGLGPIWRMP